MLQRVTKRRSVLHCAVVCFWNSMQAQSLFASCILALWSLCLISSTLLFNLHYVVMLRNVLFLRKVACVAVCYCVWQVLQCVMSLYLIFIMFYSPIYFILAPDSLVLRCDAVCCRILQCVPVCSSVFQRVAVIFSLLKNMQGRAGYRSNVREFRGIQCTKYFIELVFVEPNQFFGRNRQVICVRETCVQRSSEAAGTLQEANTERQRFFFPCGFAMWP